MASVADKHPLEWLARSGYAARGIVYVIIGWLALVAAVGPGGQTTGSKGALQSMLGEPFGKVLLAIIAVGLLGYVAWRATQAIRDTDHHGTDPKGLAVRGGLAVSAVTHTLLAVFAISLIFGLGGSGGRKRPNALARSFPSHARSRTPLRYVVSKRRRSRKKQAHLTMSSLP